MLRALILSFLVCSSVVAEYAKAATTPPAALSAGYIQNTFHSEFDKSSIDLANARDSGAQWYVGRFFSYPPLDRNALKFNEDSSITINNTGYANYGISTAGPGKAPGEWVGTAFGGGAYIQAVMRFDPSKSGRNGKRGWPAFWSLALEHLTGMSDEQWKGQAAGFKHFIEVDFFEYNLQSYGVSQNYYAATMHDWFGAQKQTCAKNFCKVSSSVRDRKISLPADIDFSRFHSYGFLWIPASSSAKGRAAFFFDDKQVSPTYTWDKFDNQAPSGMDNAGWKFGVLDDNHLALILGTGEDQPLTVRSVNVWQRSSRFNLHR